MKDFVQAPNIHSHPEVYELENEALLRSGRLELALRKLCDWRGRRFLDIGCGTGFWLPHYQDAAVVWGVEPDPDLLPKAVQRVESFDHVQALAGSAESLPLPDHSIDVAHARFAYFFGPGAERGLEEVRRVLAPEGVFIAIDNGWGGGDFAELLRDATGGNADMDPNEAERWWLEQGAKPHTVLAGWEARNAEELERILRIEFPGDTVTRFLQRHQGPSLTYQMRLWCIQGPLRAAL